VTSRDHTKDARPVVSPNVESQFMFGTSIISVQKYCVIVTWQNVAIVVWRYKTRAEDVRFASDALHIFSKDNPEGVGLVQIIEDRGEAVSLPPDARAAISKLLDRGRQYIKCSTIVFAGEGFRASAVRGIVTGIAWLTRPGFPHQVFARTSDAVSLQATYLAPRGSEKKWSDLLVKVIRRASEMTAPAEVNSGSPPLDASARLLAR
jgi:hypothetical protein